MRETIIIGSGPSGLTAAIYAARANLHPLVIEGVDAGGQLMLTTDVENYPGFPEGIMGPDMMGRFREQAERFGSEFVTANVTRVDLSSRPFGVWVDDQEHRAKSIIVSTGARARMLGLESEQALIGHGVSTCATCDGFFFRDQEIAVVGGGDSALEESLFLTKFATKVTVIHRRDELRASKIMQERALANDRITFLWDSVVEEVIGEGTVSGIAVRNLKTDAVSEISLQGLFVAIGHIPNTDLFAGQLDLNDEGYIVTLGQQGKSPATATNIEGVFACGDAVDHVYRQAITAAGMGCQAAIDTERWLEAKAHEERTAAA
ncbi:MAG TPA: thioredoxin-disulfide reductase [Acidimicrobiia bacterium]|nr:thioredoxin-disulfide reductase [Acidimicrobiia bacterium]